MPIELTLAGRIDTAGRRLQLSEARHWLARAAVWFEAAGDAVLDARLGRDADGRPTLLVSLHPSAPPASVRLGGNGRVRIHATTTPAGPGYHVALCDLLAQFADDFEVAWDEPDGIRDPTGYFASADRRRGPVEARFLNWLSSVCAAQLKHPPVRGPFAVGLPAAVRFTHPGEVHTPLGPRPRAWLAAVAAHPAAGRDFFPWWCPDLDAAFYRGRAVARLWADFPWRPPLTEDEGEVADQISNDLAAALKLDPAADLPWREWNEVLAAIAGDRDGYTVNPPDPALSGEILRRTAAAAAGPLIGYRRLPVRVALGGGWSIEVPGAFAQEREGDRTWTGWDESRTVWFHALGYAKPDGSAPTAEEAVAVGRRSLPDGEAVPGWDRGGVRGEAVFGRGEEEDGRPVWRLSGLAAVAGQLVLCNVYSEAPDCRDWAVHTLRSLEFAAG